MGSKELILGAPRFKTELIEYTPFSIYRNLVSKTELIEYTPFSTGIWFPSFQLRGLSPIAQPQDYSPSASGNSPRRGLDIGTARWVIVGILPDLA